MSRQRHLLSVWDPSRGSDPMQEHIQLLLEQRRRQREGGLPDDDVFVWWGKIRSPNRQQPMSHLDEILRLDESLGTDGGPGAEIHLYLTDYRSLYVAHVGEITKDDVAESDPELVPRSYAGASCDCWFQLWDIRRLVPDDTLGVIAELRKLRNTRYHDRPVSIYGGMVELPLIVTRDDDVRWFDAQVRAQLIDGRSWAEFDAERTGLGAIERDLRDNLFGAVAWQRLDPAARTFIATAEKVFRENRGESAMDFAPVLLDFAKAVEVQVNQLVQRGLRGAPVATRQALIDGRTVDLTREGPLTLGTLARVIGEERAVNAHLKRALDPGEWFTASLPPILAALADARNPAAHRTRLDRDDAVAQRDRMVGVGCDGDLVKLARTRVVGEAGRGLGRKNSRPCTLAGKCFTGKATKPLPSSASLVYLPARHLLRNARSSST